VLFFVSVGMLFDPRVLIDSPLEVLGVVAIILVGKSLAAFILVLALRYPLNTAITVSASLAQIGEFSFILAALGMSLGLMPVMGQNLILAGAIISIAVNPLMFKLAGPLQEWLRAKSNRARSMERSLDPLRELPTTIPHERLSGQVVLVGYGRVGRRIAAELDRQGVHYVVAEQNRELVEDLRRRDRPAVAGNAADPAVLIQAHVTHAAVLVIATPDTFHVRAMIETARALNPGIRCIVRTHNDEEARLLREDTGGIVLIGEHELADSMARHVMEGLATHAPAH
jgi:CPA2 family monovalent cation:H+ antiporter-2